MTTSPNLPLAVLEGTGLPTEEELAALYPPLYTWDDLRTFINVGDLALLKRNKRLYERFDSQLFAETAADEQLTDTSFGLKALRSNTDQCVRIQNQSNRMQLTKIIANYVQSYRIQWGMPDKLSLLRSDPASPLVAKLVTPANDNIKRDWFTADISPNMICIMKNDWPLPRDYDLFVCDCYRLKFLSA
jgi:hypothetical protein